MSFWKRRNVKSSASTMKRLRFEQLEDKRLLAIVWANEHDIGANDPQFNTYGLNEATARTIVNRAIDNWEAVITDFNYDGDNNPNTVNGLNDTYQLTVSAGTFAGGLRAQTQFPAFINGQPISTTITMDDNGGGDVGDSWFFDTTPLDDVEFTGIADAFQASFVDATTVGQANHNDFYRTITHEIGHALGILIDVNGLDSGNFDVQNQQNGLFFASPFPPNNVDPRLGALTYVGADQVGFGRTTTLLLNGVPTPFTIANELWQYTLADNTTVTFTESGGGHFYEGVADPNVAGADQHLNELMNAGRTVPAGNNPAETTRQFISDLDAMILADAYGYTVTLPSTLDSAHVMLDQYTGTLLVQGIRDANGNAQNETFAIDRVTDANGDDIRVTVTRGGDTFVERVPYAEVTEILVHDNGHAGGGNDPVTVNANVDQPWRLVDYVVSSNLDRLETAGQSTTDGIVDIGLDANGNVVVGSVVPGNQTTLRAAIVEANARTGAQSIYVGRGVYDLTLTGTGGTTQGDLDIVSDVTIIGAGAGATVIDAGGLGDRIFDVATNQSLDLSHVTLTGGGVGTTGLHGAAVYVRSGGSLELLDSAIVNNSTTVNAAIRRTTAKSIGSGVSLRRCSPYFTLPAVVRGRYSKNWSVPTSRVFCTSTIFRPTAPLPGILA